MDKKSTNWASVLEPFIKYCVPVHGSQRILSLYPADTMGSEHPEQLLRFQVKTQTLENH